MKNSLLATNISYVGHIGYCLEQLQKKCSEAEEIAEANKEHSCTSHLVGVLIEISDILFYLEKLDRNLSKLTREFFSAISYVDKDRLNHYLSQVKTILLKLKLQLQLILVDGTTVETGPKWSEVLYKVHSIQDFWYEKIEDCIDGIQLAVLEQFSSFTIDNQYQFFSTTYLDEKDAKKLRFEQMMHNARKAEKEFFAFNHERHPQYSALLLYRNEIKSELLHRGRATKTINLNSLNGRDLISVYSQAIEDNIPPVTKGLSHKQFLEKTKFHSCSQIRVKKGKKPRESAREFNIYSQFKPFRGHTGNHFIAGVGSYGSKKPYDILNVINAITLEKPEFERQLARLFLLYKSGKPDAFSYESLAKVGINLKKNNKNDNTLKRLYKIAYLFCYMESIRRMNPGYIGDYKVPKLPFNTAVICALLLIYHGNLKMKDVFSEDSIYGVVTGTKIISKKNIDHTTMKFQKLLKLFLEKQVGHFAEESLSALTNITCELYPYAPTKAIFFSLLLHVDEGKETVTLPQKKAKYNEVDSNNLQVDTGISSSKSVYSFKLNS